MVKPLNSRTSTISGRRLGGLLPPVNDAVVIGGRKFLHYIVVVPNPTTSSNFGSKGATYAKMNLPLNNASKLVVQKRSETNGSI